MYYVYELYMLKWNVYSGLNRNEFNSHWTYVKLETWYVADVQAETQTTKLITSTSFWIK